MVNGNRSVRSLFHIHPEVSLSMTKVCGWFRVYRAKDNSLYLGKHPYKTMQEAMDQPKQRNHTWAGVIYLNQHYIMLEADNSQPNVQMFNGLDRWSDYEQREEEAPGYGLALSKNGRAKESDQPDYPLRKRDLSKRSSG